MNHKIKIFVNKLSEPRMFKKIMHGLGIFFIAFFIFQTGMFVGFHKASFRHDWDDNFSRNFGPMTHGRMTGIMPENFPNVHGSIGKIIKIELPTLIVEDKDNTEKVILITDTTQIRTMREKKKKNDLKIDSDVVVIGSPNVQGQIEAKLIRILPALSPDMFNKQD